MNKLVLLLSVLCACVVHAQVPVRKCPEITSVQQNFDLEKYLGTWYEEEKYFAIFELGGRCNTAEYSLNENGTVRVLNTQISKLTGKESSIEGYAKPAGTNNEGKFLVNFPGKGIPDAPYWVLETDYTNYAVVWSCVEIPPIIGQEFAWILTRERSPSKEIVDKATAVFDRLNLSRKVLIKTDQTNC